jgi:hypothetical protein
MMDILTKKLTNFIVQIYRWDGLCLRQNLKDNIGAPQRDPGQERQKVLRDANSSQLVDQSAHAYSSQF